MVKAWETRQLPHGVTTSWRLAGTLALGRNTVLAILKDAGIQCSHGTPSTEAAASTVAAPRGLLLVSNATMMHSALKDTARELGVNAEWRLFYAAHSSHAGKPGYNMQLTKVIGSLQADRSWCVVTARACSSSPVTMSGPLISKNAAARIDGFRAGNIAAVRYRTTGLRPRVRLRRAPVNLRSTGVGS